MTDQLRPATTEVARYTLAYNDMRDVSVVARIIADHDPEFAFMSPPAQYKFLGDLHLRQVLETGVIVTYARPFTDGKGSGFPLRESKVVPADKREFHREILALRDRIEDYRMESLL